MAKPRAANQAAPKKPKPKPKAKPKAKATPKRPSVLAPLAIGATGLRHDTFVGALAVSPDGARVAIGDHDGRVRVFDRATSACIFEATWHARDRRGRHGIQRLAFSHDSAVITALTGINGHGNLCAGHLASATTWFETPTEYYSVAYAPDNRQLAAVRWGHVDIVNARDGTSTIEIALPEHLHPKELAWSRVGARIVVSAYDREKSTTSSVLVLDGASFEVLGTYDLGVDLAATQLTCLPDGNVVAIVVDDYQHPAPRLVRFDPSTGTHDDRPIAQTFAPYPHFSVLPARGEAVCVSANAGVAFVIDLANARVVRELAADTRHAAETSDGSLVATAHGVAIRVWDRDWNECSAAPGLSTRVGTIAFTPDGQRIVTGDRTGVRTWSLDGAPLASLDLGHVVTVAPDASCAMVVHENATFVVDLPAGTRRPGAIARDLRHARCSPDGRHAALGRYPEGHIELWSFATGACVHTLPLAGNSVYGIGFSTDGTRIAGGAWESSIRIFDVAIGEQLTDIYFRGSWGQVALSFDRDNKLLASGDHGRTIRLWKLPWGKLAHTLVGHRRKVIQVTAFSPDGALLASADEADIRIWRVSDGKPLAVARVGADCLAFSPDGTRLAAGADGTAYLFDVSSL